MTDSREFQISRILMPYDGPDASETALAYAARIPCDEIVLLHVDVADELLIPELGEEGITIHDMMERLARQFSTDQCKVRVEVRLGDVAEAVIAAGRDADLIVMMTHGRGAAGRAIFGSVADRVVRHGETPTLLLRIADRSPEPKTPTRIVVALDGSEIAEQSLPAAQAVGLLLDVPVVLMRVVSGEDVQHRMRQSRDPGQAPYDDSPTFSRDVRRTVVDEATAYLKRRSASLRNAGLEVEDHVVEGMPSRLLLWELAPDDLLVMTTRGHGGFKRWSIGSVAEKLVREAPCPILLQRGGE